MPAVFSWTRSIARHPSFKSSSFASCKKGNLNGLVITIPRRLIPGSSLPQIAIFSTKSKLIDFAKISTIVLTWYRFIYHRYASAARILSRSSYSFSIGMPNKTGVRCDGYMARLCVYLRYHDWPGNVRELQNYVERAVILGTGPELTVDHLPPQLRGQPPPRPIRPKAGGTDLTALSGELVRQGIRTAGPTANDLYDRIVGQIERELIQQVLQACDRVQIKAASRLGINRNTLHKKLSEYQLDEADSGEITKLPNHATTNRRNGNADFDEDDTTHSRLSKPAVPINKHQID